MLPKIEDLIMVESEWNTTVVRGGFDPVRLQAAVYTFESENPPPLVADGTPQPEVILIVHTNENADSPELLSLRSRLAVNNHHKLMMTFQTRAAFGRFCDFLNQARKEAAPVGVAWWNQLQRLYPGSRDRICDNCGEQITGDEATAHFKKTCKPVLSEEMANAELIERQAIAAVHRRKPCSMGVDCPLCAFEREMAQVKQEPPPGLILGEVNGISESKS